MMLFERERAPEGALMFARAALEAAATAYSACEAAAAAADGMDHELPGRRGALLATRRLREGRLWSNVFSYSCEMRDYEVRAMLWRDRGPRAGCD